MERGETSTSERRSSSTNAIDAFKSDYTKSIERPEGLRAFFNTNGLYRHSRWDFKPWRGNIDANITPGSGGHIDVETGKLVWDPDRTASWDVVLQDCGDSERLFRRWRPDYGREVYGFGSIVLRSYHMAAPIYRWYDYSLSDERLKTGMLLAKEAIQHLDIAVPEVYFAGMVRKASLLATKRIPGIALDRIVEDLPPEDVADLDTQIHEITQTLKNHPYRLSTWAPNPSVPIPTEYCPQPEAIGKICAWFEEQWDSQPVERVPSPDLQNSTSEVMNAWKSAPEHDLYASITEKWRSTSEIILKAPLQDRVQFASFQGASRYPPTEPYTYVRGNPWNWNAPDYGGVESDVDSEENEFGYENVIVSAGKIVGIQGKAILRLLR